MDDANIYKMNGKTFVGSYAKVEIEVDGKKEMLDIADKTPNVFSDISILAVGEQKDINLLLGLNPTHISTYSLIIEPHTKLYIDGCEYIDEDIDNNIKIQLDNPYLKQNPCCWP